jgi:hypothetical protein
MLSLTSIHWFYGALSLFRIDLPAALVILISIVIGLLMVILFRYTSDQKAIHVAKDQLKAHLLAVRLYQDQLPVVLSSYGRIVRGTGRYLRLAFMPLLIVIIPLTFVMVQIDRYLGSQPLQPGETFLLKARATSADVLNELELQLPAGLETSAPAVHVPGDNEVLWRLVANKIGTYDVEVGTARDKASKRLVVSTGLDRLSAIRLRGEFWQRLFFSAEPALPVDSPVQSIEVDYPSRNIYFAGFEWNWIWLFFVLSLIAGFFFKTVLRIEI